MSNFKKPEFGEKCLELRAENGEVCIYGNQEGLRKLASVCLQLADKTKNTSSEHVHLEDLQILTSESSRGVVAVFDD
jgi:hypothetical protein